jgi:hypothetical protein
MVSSKSSIWSSCWVFAFVAGLFLAVFSAYPQIKLHYNSEQGTNGHYAYNDIDEVAYASYLKALIDGRPRKNDPYTGRDESAASPQPESLFSIQFASPYLVAVPARILSISAPTAMLLAGILAAFFSAVIGFWLILEISGNKWLAFAGSLFVLCGGALVAGEGAIGEILGTGFPYPYFPFLRRYVPAVPFPFCIALMLAVWKMLRSEVTSKRVTWCVASSFLFSFLVFSYFYIWTAAAAWLFCVTVVLLIVRPEGWVDGLKGLVALGIACLPPLGVYAYMLSQRVDSMDNVQLLVRTHAADLTRMPFYVGTAALLVALLCKFGGKITADRYPFVFAVATGAVPFVLFNQQVISGMSLQPIHYQVFIGNYIAGFAAVFAVGLVISRFDLKDNRLTGTGLFVIAAASACWGFVECHYTVRVLDGANLERDRAFKAGEFLTAAAADSKSPHQDTILSFSSIQGDDFPTVAPQNILWSRHQHVFAGLSWPESKERFLMQLYYEGRTPEWLDFQLKNRNYVAMIALFGWGRHSDRLTTDSTPLTFREIDDVVERFRALSEKFDLKKAGSPELKYLVGRQGRETNFENVDRWYDRELLKNEEGFEIYRLTLKKK